MSKKVPKKKPPEVFQKPKGYLTLDDTEELNTALEKLADDIERSGMTPQQWKRNIIHESAF